MSDTLSIHGKNEEETEEFLLFPEENESLHFSSSEVAETDDMWTSDHTEGKLALDVYETSEDLVILSAIAGVKPEHLEIFVQNDMLTVRGKRAVVADARARYIVRECHWGSFSRSVILPTEVDVDAIAATLKDGVLIIRMPKVHRSKKIAVQEII